jgi:hypothetical protein
MYPQITCILKSQIYISHISPIYTHPQVKDIPKSHIPKSDISPKIKHISKSHTYPNHTYPKITHPQITHTLHITSSNQTYPQTKHIPNHTYPKSHISHNCTYPQHHTYPKIKCILKSHVSS